MSGDCDFNWRSTPEVKIPFGYVRVETPCQSARGMAMWNGEKFERIRKQCSPTTAPTTRWPTMFWPVIAEGIIIRRAKVEQQTLPI